MTQRSPSFWLFWNTLKVFFICTMTFLYSFSNRHVRTCQICSNLLWTAICKGKMHSKLNLWSLPPVLLNIKPLCKHHILFAHTDDSFAIFKNALFASTQQKKIMHAIILSLTPWFGRLCKLFLVENLDLSINVDFKFLRKYELGILYKLFFKRTLRKNLHPRSCI